MREAKIPLILITGTELLKQITPDGLFFLKSGNPFFNNLFEFFKLDVYYPIDYIIPENLYYISVKDTYPRSNMIGCNDFDITIMAEIVEVNFSEADNIRTNMEGLTIYSKYLYVDDIYFVYEKIKDCLTEFWVKINNKIRED